MHEFSLLQSMNRMIAAQAGQQQFERVKCVWVELGSLAGIDAESLRFGFDEAMTGSVAEGARFEIIHIPAEGHCQQCNITAPMSQRVELCPRCGGLLQLTCGDELRIKELEVV